MMRKSLAGLFFGLTVAFGAVASAQEADGPSLKPGDQAPPLTVAKWLKGDPVEEFEAGKVYVVEFWATWCGPCRTSIPHLTELQERYKDKGVTIVGVDAFEQDFSEAAPFVEEMGDKMVYSVAQDSVPEGKSAGDGAMAKNWMDAAGQNGIPTAFVVNGDGVVAWIGHPMSMDEPLEQIVAGDYDIEAAAKAAEEERAAEGALTGLMEKLQAAGGDPDKIQALMPEFDDAIAAANDTMKPQLRLMKFNVLATSGATEAAVEPGRELMDSPLGENPQLLNMIAWTLVDPAREGEPAGKEALALAREAAEKADKLSDGGNWMYLDTLARVYFVEGDAAKALAAQEKAVELAGDELDDQPDVKDRLEEYRKAVKK